MSEKKDKLLTKACRAERARRPGFKALKRAYLRTPWNERKSFNPYEILAGLKKRDIVRRAAVYEAVNQYRAALPQKKAARRRAFWRTPLALMALAAKRFKR